MNVRTLKSSSGSAITCRRVGTDGNDWNPNSEQKRGHTLRYSESRHPKKGRAISRKLQKWARERHTCKRLIAVPHRPIMRITSAVVSSLDTGPTHDTRENTWVLT